MTSLKAFSRWAGYDDLFEDYNGPDAGEPIPHPIPEGMPGVRRMIAATQNERQRCLLALLGMVGLRMAEALSINATHIINQGGSISLRVLGKGERWRTVPVSDEAFEHIIRPYLRCVGTDLTLVQLKDRFARRVVTDLALKAGLSRRVASHDLRATFATAVYNKTGSQRLVQMLLGHRDGRNTEVYIGVEESQMRDGVMGL